MNKKIFVAAALPYANGSLHLGHVGALIGSDIFARYHRLCGKDVLFVSGSDCHGTPIAVEADRQGISPSSIANKYHAEFRDSLTKGLGFSYDIYTTTTTKTHEEVVQEIFLKLYNEGLIYSRNEELPFCSHCKRFLPDRYIEGLCPTCGFKGARGDQCDGCGKLINPKELKNPRCKICGKSPTWKSTEHFFFRLTSLQSQLEKWVASSEGWRTNARAFAENFLKQGLQDRAITRDTTWGVKIPLKGYEDKRIYVWFEAVCAYLSASKEWSEQIGNSEAWKRFWLDDDVQHYYFHGKDNIPFHTIIWPAILLAYDGGLHLPDRIYSSEYLTLEKKQFSKSRHWAVWLPDFLKQFDSETLRFYLTLAGPETSDADFSWEEYRLRTNAELIGNFGNFIHRTLSIVKLNFPEGIRFPQKLDETSQEFLGLAQKTFSKAGGLIEDGHFRLALKSVLSLVEHGNRYFNSVEPWKTVKENRQKAEDDLAVVVQVIRSLAILSNPFLPRSSERICQQTQDPKPRWEYPEPKSVFLPGKFSPLYTRIESSVVQEQKSKLGKKGE